MTQQLELHLAARVPARYRHDVDVDQLKRVLERALLAEGKEGKVEVSLVVAGEAVVRRLNKDFRGVDRVTDVLSFPMLDPDQAKVQGEPFPDALDHVLRLGDIVICLPRAKRQAVEYGHSLARELGYLAVHGLLHLEGHDHESEAERQVMRDKEEAALNAGGLGR